MNPALDASTEVDYVVPDGKLRCRDPRFDPGGGGINVSRAIKNLGGESLAILLAGGPSGELLTQLLEAERVSFRAIPIRRATRENFNVTEKTTGRQYRFCMPGPRVEPEEWRECLSTLEEVEPFPRYVVASGSLPPGVPADFYARLATLCRKHVSRLLLDTAGEPLRLALEEKVFLVKPSLAEFEELAGVRHCEEPDLPQLASRIRLGGKCEVVVLSLGSRGAFWMSEEGRGRLASPAVAVRSGVGAGDSMVAAIALMLSRGRPVPEAIRYGVAAGAAAVLNEGTMLCRREDVERLQAQVLASP
jgi:6-phosphofructokinase 2